VSVEELVAKNRELEKLLKKREKGLADEKETAEILKKWLCWANPYARPRLANFLESVSPFQAVYSLRNRSFFWLFRPVSSSQRFRSFDPKVRPDLAEPLFMLRIGILLFLMNIILVLGEIMQSIFLIKIMKMK
jgi:hypothetical protein